MKLPALVAYLAARPGRRATRDQLIDLFWADSPVEKARNSLRQALHKLRPVLGDDLTTEAGSSEVVLGARVTTDRDAFLQALDAGSLEQAVNTYAGPFAPGIVSAGSAGFEHWADTERARLHDLFAAAAETVAQRMIAAGNPRGAAALAHQLLDADPLDERAWRLRLEAELASGSRVHVAASIAELRRRLADDQRQPEPRTRQLMERLGRLADNVDGAHPGPTLVADLVGREQEFGRLFHGWRTAATRRTTHMQVTAPPGVGKTRLLDDFAFRLEAERARVVRVRATPRQRNVSGAVLSFLIGELAELPGATGIADRTARILVDLQPGIAARFPNSTPIPVADADERRRMRTDALVDLLGALADEAPLCLLLDDMHWWDSYSREITADAIDRVSGKAMLSVTASRPGNGEVTTSISESVLTLKPLHREHIRALLTSLGDTPDEAAIERLADGLHRATDGVPLLVIEAIRLGLDRNFLSLHHSQWHFDRLDEFLSSLRPGAVLIERITALNPVQRDLLLLAAVIEHPLGDVDVAAAQSAATSSTLIELEHLGMLSPARDGWIVAHDVIAQIAIEHASARERAAAHQTAGQMLAGPAETEVQFAEAARHLAESGENAELAATCAKWIRRCRAHGDHRPAAMLVRELLGPQATATTVEVVVQRLPTSASPRPWRKRAYWAAAGAAILLATGAVWRLSAVPDDADATVGIFVGAPDSAIQYAIPLRANNWTRSRAELHATTVTGSRGGFPGPRARLTDMPMPSPDGSKWLVVRSVTGELRPTELFLIDSSGVERPIAPAPGDDVTPDWAPDGRSAVFATMRSWSPGPKTFNLAVVDLASRSVRRLTN
ncbi:MAG: AAA family ATPase, partial [Gemmatimonadota bacterium]